jgi:hypothetical protein
MSTHPERYHGLKKSELTLSQKRDMTRQRLSRYALRQWLKYQGPEDRKSYLTRIKKFLMFPLKKKLTSR